MNTAAVCQPEAQSPPSSEVLAASASTWNGCGIVGAGKAQDLFLGKGVRAQRMDLADGEHVPEDHAPSPARVVIMTVYSVSSTVSPFWFRIALCSLATPSVGRLAETRAACTVIVPDSVSPGRTGFSQLT